MSSLIANPKTETMCSSQLAEMLPYEKQDINKKVRAMFLEKIEAEIISVTLRSNGQVDEYNLPELESKMFVAKHDIKYLEQITQYWIERKNHSVEKLTPAEMILVQAQQLVEHERRMSDLEHQQTETACQVKALVDGGDYFTVVGYANIVKVRIDTFLSSRIGKKASQICRDNDWHKGETTHPVYGVCGTYPREALEQAFNETLEAGNEF